MILLLMKVFTLHNPRRDQKAQGETSTIVRLRQQLFWTLTDSTKIYHQDIQTDSTKIFHQDIQTDSTKIVVSYK